MAVIRPGETISKVQGKVKNHVYSSWRGRGYVRSKSANRSNPRSSAQSVERSGTSALSKTWNDTLSDSQRALWNELAQFIGSASMDTVNREPGSRSVIPSPKPVMSGYNAFMRYNLRLIEAGIRALGNPLLDPTRVSPNMPTVLSGEWEPADNPLVALDFDGVDEFVLFGNVLGYEYNQAQAWEFFINTRQPLVADWCVIKMEPTFNDGYIIYIVNKVLYWQVSRFSAGEGLTVTRAFDLPDAWHHVVCTYDGSNNANAMHIVVDNVPGEVIANNIPMTASIQVPDPLRFAGFPPAPGSYVFGQLDNIRNFNRQLGAPQITPLWNGGAGVCSNDPLGDGSCQGSWPVRRGRGPTLYDDSGNGYNGALQNMEPGDWVPGHVLCTVVPSGIKVEWTDPDDCPPGARIRVWLMSYDAHVHKQLIGTVALGEEELRITNVRIAQGKTALITNLPGHYLIQVDCVGPNGGQSGPSNTIEVTVPSS